MEIYIVSIISAFLGYASSRFASQKPQGFLPNVGILTILALGAAALTFVGQWIIRPSQAPPNRLEGQWIERYTENEKARYAIATFKNNPEANVLEFSGKAYDLEQGFVGEWHAIEARVYRDQYDYLFEGRSINPDPERRGHRMGVGTISFDSHHHGKGVFLSIREDREPRDFDLHRILNEDAVRESLKDPESLITKLSKDPIYFREITIAN